MSRDGPELVFFDEDAPHEVIVHLRELAGDRSGWLVLEPEVDLEDPSEVPRTGGLFSGRGPAVPELSWVPGRPGRRGTPPISVGIRHASGPKLVDRLAEQAHVVPSDWEVVDDSPKRGLVARLPPAADQADVLAWLLRAGELVSLVPLTGRWRASVHRYV